jgi:hypothetical protein
MFPTYSRDPEDLERVTTEVINVLLLIHPITNTYDLHLEVRVLYAHWHAVFDNNFKGQ